MSAISFSSAVDQWRFTSTTLNPSRFKIDAQGRAFTKFEDAYLWLDENRVRVLKNDYFVVKSALASVAKIVVVVANGVLFAPMGMVWNGGLMSYHRSKSLLNYYCYNNQETAYRNNLIDFIKAKKCFTEDFSYSLLGCSPILLGVCVHLAINLAKQLKEFPYEYEIIYIQGNFVHYQVKHTMELFRLQSSFFSVISVLTFALIVSIFWYSTELQGVFEDSTVALRNKYDFNFPRGSKAPTEEEQSNFVGMYLGSYLHEKYGISGTDGKILNFKAGLSSKDAVDFAHKIYIGQHQSKASKLASELAKLSGVEAEEIKKIKNLSLEEIIQYFKNRSLPISREETAAKYEELAVIARELDKKAKEIYEVADKWLSFRRSYLSGDFVDFIRKTVCSFYVNDRPNEASLSRHPSIKLSFSDLELVDLSKFHCFCHDNLKKYVQFREILVSKDFRGPKELVDQVLPILRKKDQYEKKEFFKGISVIVHPDKFEQAFGGRDKVPAKLIIESNEIRARIDRFLKEFDPS